MACLTYIGSFFHVVPMYRISVKTPISFCRSSFQNEIFWNNLVHHQINALAKSCLIKGEADEYYQRALVRRCFDHMQAWVCRKAENEHDLALLRSMPPCPSVHLDALRLAGLCATKGRRYGVRRTQSNREDPSSPGHSVLVSYPLSRFSAWAERVRHCLRY